MQVRLLLDLALLLALPCLSLLGCLVIAQQQKDAHFARLSQSSADVKFPESLKGKISYDADNERLLFKGVMTEGERDELLRLSKDAQYKASVETLFHRTQNKEIRHPSSTTASNDNKLVASKKEVSPGITENKERPKQTELTKESPQGHKGTVEGTTTLEKQKATVQRQPLASGSPTTKEEDKDIIEAVAEQIVCKFEEGFPPTKEKEFNVLVRPFSTLDGRLTMLSNLLAEELFTQLSNSRWGGSSLKVCCNPIGGATPSRLDGIITGSMVRIGEEIKVNARLVSADTHVILSAVSTKIPVSEIVKPLFETEIPLEKPPESEDLNTRLDSLAWQVEQILHDLQGNKKEEQRICILSFSTLEGKKNPLGQFLAQECVLRLSKNKSWKLVPEVRVEQLLSRKVTTVSDLSTTELTTKLSRELGIDAVIDGTVTDLGNSVKLNLRVSDTVVGLTWGTASVEILRDKRVEYLLGSETGQFPASGGSVSAITTRESLKTTHTPERPQQKAPEAPVASRLEEEFFLQEDFSGPDVVTRLPEWGQDLIITGEGEKRFLTAQGQSFVTIERKIEFPGNFSFEFEVKGSSKYWNTLKFTDATGNEFGLDFQLNEGNCYIVLPGPKSVRVKVDTTSSNRFRLTRRDGFYEVYVNDSMALAGPYSKYSLFKSFTLIARLDQIRFTGFVGKIIRG